MFVHTQMRHAIILAPGRADDASCLAVAAKEKRVLSTPNAVGAAAELIERALGRGRRALSEHESKRVLAAYGVPTVDEILVSDAESALAAAERLGYPVVIKACAPDLMHKSDAGLVVLNVYDETSVRRAVAELEVAVDVELDGFLVQPMVRGKREVIVGGLRDPLFGPCVMLGLGGILVEALGDVTFRLVPLEERDAIEMLTELRAQRVFEAVRGEPAIDRAALAQILMN
ncbi:MAG TPA: hypothetical protein ENN80_11945, partial [Candidatus Hydrogenedentes bacterium]|nr:hypothetical protein [Candidatus Hydrogenedentota bacterium]